MSNKKHPPPLRCRIRKALFGVSPSAVMAGGCLTLRRMKKCRGCTENAGERIQEGFEEGLRRGSERPSIQAQLMAHAMEKLKEMPQPTLTRDIKAVDLRALEEVNELADDAVAAGWLTQREVDALWDDFAPDLTDY